MIGMRLIKSGLAVIIAAFIAKHFNFSTPFFICMTAFISMEKTLLTSLALGRNRVVGTAIGAIIGGIFSIYFPGNPIIAGIGVMIAIKVCTILNLHGAIFISGIVCIACTLHVSSGRGVDYAISRTIETFLGMLISIGINIIFFPYYNIERLSIIENNLINAIKSNNTQSINLHIAQFKNTIELYKNEFMSNRKKEMIEKYLNHLLLFEKIKQHVDVIQIIDDKDIKSYHKDQIKKMIFQIEK